MLHLLCNFAENLARLRPNLIILRHLGSPILKLSVPLSLRFLARQRRITGIEASMIKICSQAEPSKLTVAGGRGLLEVEKRDNLKMLE